MLEAIVDIFVGHFREYVALHQVPVQARQKCVMAIWAYVPCMRLLEGRGSCRQGVSPGHHAFGQPVDIGLTKPLVIETDGAIEQADALKAAYSGAVQTDLQVAHDPPDKALLLLGIAARQVGLRALSGQFLSCRIKCVCGGGLYAHRYRPGSGFYNPSVYCPDLWRLISHIRQIMQVGIDDLDPFRMPAVIGLAPRLGVGEVGRRKRSIEESWQPDDAR